VASALSGPGIWAARHPRSGLPLALVLLLPLPLVIGRAAAAEHVAESWVTVRSDYNSNLRYFRSGDDAVTSLGVSPGFRLSSLTPTDGLLLNGSLGAIRNDTIDPRNRLDVLAGLTWRQTGERDAIDVAATWTRDATLSVRTADAATNGQASQLVQTGQVFAWAERNQYTLAPTLMHALDERNRLGLVASAQVVRFRDAPAGLVDYDNLSLGPQWIRQADARTRYTLSLAARAAGIDIHWRGTGLDEQGIDASGQVRVVVDPRYFRPTEVDSLLGDPTRARERLGWRPRTDFETLVAEMMREDMRAAERDHLVRRNGFPVCARHE
jgi:hypothetical protein